LVAKSLRSPKFFFFQKLATFSPLIGLENLHMAKLAFISLFFFIKILFEKVATKVFLPKSFGHYISLD